MRFNIIAECVLVLLVFHNCEAERRKRLEVEVFYSPFDKRSADFVLSQVFTVSSTILSLYFDLSIYPFAGCKMEKDKLSCQSGPEEITASMHQFCSYQLLSPAHKGYRDSPYVGASYLACLFKYPYDPANINYERCKHFCRGIQNQVDTCVNKTDNEKVSAAVARSTRMNPGYIPYVLIDGKQSKAQDEQAVKRFWVTICHGLGSQGPSECTNITRKLMHGSSLDEEPKISSGVGILSMYWVMIVVIVFLLP